MVIAVAIAGTAGTVRWAEPGIDQADTNAFVAAVSRLGYALSRDGWLPTPIAHLSQRNMPTGGIAAVGLVGGLGLLLAWLFGWGTEQIVFIPATLVIVVYLIGPAAAVKLLHGPQRVIAATGTALTACALPFALGHVPRPHHHRRSRADQRPDGPPPPNGKHAPPRQVGPRATNN